MNQDWILHNSHDPFFRAPFGAVPCNQEITLRLKAFGREKFPVFLRYRLDGKEEQEILMELGTEEEGEKVYQAILRTPEKPGLMWYYFLVRLGERPLYYGNVRGYGGRGGLTDGIPPAYQITVYREGAKTPDWFKEGVMYQIFVDRFYNGCEDGKVLNPKPGILLHANWDDQPAYLFRRNSGEIARWSFFGGNLPGVRKKLAYLKELGIRVIYLNPIFEAPSNHKYDTADYHKIDPMYGDNSMFQELCAEAREMGIAIILDGVFSHTGSDSIYFNKFGRYDSLGAYQSKDSPYYRWYFFRDYPDNYDCWWGIDTLPNVNELEPSYQNFIIFDENSVLKYWQRAGIKGWRLDVADELPGEFIKNFRRVLKERDPEAVLIGEVWEDASHKISYGRRREYLLGEELDSVMNYPFRHNVLEFMTCQRDAEATSLAMMSLYENYPLEHFYSAMNFLGSHDVPRVLTILKAALPVEMAEEEKHAIALARLKLLALWQMTFPGVPCVYYGDEAQMEGWDDPLNRGTYPWGRENQELLQWHKEVIALRNHYDVFRTGRWQPLYNRGDLFSYLRIIEQGHDIFGRRKRDNVALVFFNRSKDQKISLSLDVRPWVRGSRLVDIFRDYAEIPLEEGRLNLTLQPLEGRVLLQDRWGTNLEDKRECGILLHPTSFPSRYGIGDLGQGAYEFVDFLARSGQKLWQILPLNPPGYGGSPYQCLSAFAGNPLLIDPAGLVEEGLLPAEDLAWGGPPAGNSLAGPGSPENPPGEVNPARKWGSFGEGAPPAFDPDKVDFEGVRAYKEMLFRQAFAKFRTLPRGPAYARFVEEHHGWLEDYALYMALKGHFQGLPWNRWDKAVAWREQGGLTQYRTLLAEEIAYHQFLQYFFFSQWHKLKEYANAQGIKIIGDIPIFVAHDSCDVWMAPEFFDLDDEGNPAYVAGVPPDYFSATGQRWGNPLYKWDAMSKDDYRWWRDRLETLFKLVDIVRIDHFRGFEGYWEVPAAEETAVRGRWVKGPGEKFFRTVKKYLGDLPIIAEDLGFITPEVEELRVRCGFPGMKIMQFEMNPGEEIFLLPLHKKHTVVYTGSHDNDTLLGWYLTGQGRDGRRERAGLADGEAEAICWRFIELAYRSNAATVIVPLQDILCLGSEARMNTPGTMDGNWTWRFRKGVLTREMEERLKALVEKYRR